MKQLKKTLSLLLAVALIATSAAFAIAESADTANQETVTPNDGTAAADTVYTLDEMLTQAMANAYSRQAAYAAYAEAFPDSRSIAGIDMDTQIVLLEMLLKANGVALPANDAAVTAPETKAEAYEAIATAESDAVTMYKSFLQQESLAKDAQIIFSSVFRMVRSNAATFAQLAQNANRAQKLQELVNDGSAQVYVIDNGGRGKQVIYVITNDQTTANDSTTNEPAETTEPAAEGSTGN